MCKVIHREMCKNFKFDHTNKCYLHNPAPVLENDTHKLPWDLQTELLISARRPELIIINKERRTYKIVDFAVPADYRRKLKECEKKDEYFDLARELKKTIEHKGNNYTNCDWCFQHSNPRIIKGTGGFGSWLKSEHHPTYSIVKNGQNTERSPAVSQTPVKAYADVKNSHE